MGQYLPVVTMAVLAVVFAAVSLLMSKLLAPRRSTTAKRARTSRASSRPATTPSASRCTSTWWR